MPGFGLRLREGGSRTFVVQYKVGAKHRRITLGNASKITADDARKNAKRIFGKLADGKDPANECAVTKAQAALTLGAAVEDFIKRQGDHVRPRTLEETTRYLRKHWKLLHGLGLGSITRAHVAAEANKVAQRSGPVAADRARSALSAFFGWAMGEGMAQENLVIGTNRAAPAESRDHTLSDAEIVAVWNAADAATDFGKIVRATIPQNRKSAAAAPDADLEIDRVLVDGKALPLNKAKALKETYLARLRKLEFEQKSGKLVDAEVVGDEVFKLARGERDALTNWPARVAPLIAAELGVDQVKLAVVLEKYVHQHLVERSTPELRLADKTE